jgi:hypothetical protein
MKKFLALLMLVLTMTFVMPQQSKAESPPGIEQVGIVAIGIDQAQTLLTDVVKYAARDVVAVITNIGTGMQSVTTVQAQDVNPPVDPPNAGLIDIISLPAKGDTAGWIFWGLALFVFITYNVVMKLIPTSKSWTFLGILYRIFNMIIKDKATGGGALTIGKVK